MKLMHKTRIAAALAAAIAGVGASTQVMALNESQDNIGDLAIGPYYTVRAGWTADFNIINTSDSTLALKIRFHEARNSREVLDFVVVLSPKDALAGWVEEGPDGPRVRFPAVSESTCIVPTPTGRGASGSGGHLDFSSAAYSGGRWDGFIQVGPDITHPESDIDRAREGYFTVIEMGATLDELQPVAVNAKHDQGADPVQPANCGAVVDAFATVNILDTYAQFGRNLNALKVNYALTNVTRGVQGSGNAVTLANFATDGSWIAHTMNSIAAGQAAVDAAQAALAAVDDAIDDAVAEINAVANGGVCAAAATTPVVPTDPPELITAVAYGVQCNGDNADGEIGGAKDQLDAGVADYNAAVALRLPLQVALDDAENDQLDPANNLIHAQQANQFNYPHLDSGDRTAAMLIDGLYDMDAANAGFPWPALFGGHYLPRGVDALTAILMKSNVMNEWADNPNTGASSDFVMTAPTKRFYSDWASVYRDTPHLDMLSPIFGQILAEFPTGWPPFGQQFEEDAPRACDLVSISAWNRDEGGTSTGVLPSPQLERELCWETNVLSFGTTPLFDSKVGQYVDTSFFVGGGVSNRMNGWVDVDLTIETTAYHPALPLTGLTAYVIGHHGPFVELIQPQDIGENRFWVQLGMPYIGFVFKQRDLGQAASYGGLADHSYLRSFDASNAIGGTFQP